MSLKKIMKKNVVMINSSASIQDAAKLMLKKHVGDVVVTKSSQKESSKKSKLIGMITDRDLAMEFAKNHEINPNIKLSKIMSRNMTYAKESDGVYETIEKMKKNGVHRIPVINENKSVVGIITADDCLQLLGSELNTLAAISERSIENEIKSLKRVKKK